MIRVPSGVRVWLATRVTDMRLNELLPWHWNADRQQALAA